MKMWPWANAFVSLSLHILIQKMGTMIIGEGGVQETLGLGLTGRGENSWEEACRSSAEVGGVVGWEEAAGYLLSS